METTISKQNLIKVPDPYIKIKSTKTMNILSFDIEDWFHLLDHEESKGEHQWAKYESRIDQNMDKIFQLLEDTNQKATFFCLGWVARKYPEVIKKIDRAGFEVATHSDLHQLVYEQGKIAFEEDLIRSIGSLEDLTGKKVRCYRAPGFSLKPENDWVFPLLIKHGIEIDCSIFPAARSHGGFKNFGLAEPCIIDYDGYQLKEFPINLYPLPFKNLVFSGGGYFRIFPLEVLKMLFNRSEYVMTYFHPRDFDPDQPMMEGLSLVRQLKSYYGLKNCYPKLETILKTFDFLDIQTADAMLDWNKVPIKKIAPTKAIR